MMATQESSLSLTESLAQYWANAGYDDLPSPAIRAAKRALLDTVAAGVGAAESDVVNSAVAGVRAMHGVANDGVSRGSPVWGRGEYLQPAQAALVNGTACHVLELDDYGGCGHSGAVVVPAVLSLLDLRRASGRPATGRDILVAIVAGYDVAARVMSGVGGYREHTRQGWHSTGTCGSFAAAAAAARLLELNEASFVSALGIAGSFTGGIWAFLADGSMTKRLHCGKAAEAGVAGALLAQHGMTGPREVLEASWGGFYATYGGSVAEPDATLDGLGESFEILKSGMKPYPCCRDMHHAIDGLLSIMSEEGADFRQIASIRVHGNEQTVRQFGKWNPQTALDAQFSFPYALAVAAVSGGASQGQFFPLRPADPGIAHVMARVDIIPDQELAPGRYPSIEVVFVDGRNQRMDVIHAKGAPLNPLTDQELEDKARDLIVPILGHDRCSEILMTAGDMEHLDDAERFVALLGKRGALG